MLLITVFRTRLNITKDSLQIAAKRRMPQRIIELLTMANTMTDYTEQDIVDRTANIYQSFIMFVKKNKLFK